MAEREGIQERIQAEIQNENKETRVQAEEILEIPPEWNKVKDQNMEEGDSLHGDLRPEKHKREEIPRGRRKQRNEEDIPEDKQEHSPNESHRIQHPQGF